jgi:hypothetical protein
VIIVVLIVVFAGLAFTLKSGARAANQAAIEPDVIKRTIHGGESGCMGLLFCAFGVAGVLAIIALSFPGK